MASYRALRGLSYPTDHGVIERLAGGENLRYPERRCREVTVGEIVTDIPAVSLPWLLEKGYVELVAEESPRSRGRFGAAPPEEAAP